MIGRHGFDAEKGIEVLLYISDRVQDVYTALKILYFADKEHLSKYGRLICGDSYVAMRHGPVPSGIYDLVKFARGDGYLWLEIPIAEAFAIHGNAIVPARTADLDILSESEISCLDAAISLYGQMGFGELQALSHDEAFKSADRNDFMSLEGIAQTLPDGELLLDYLHNC